MTSLRSAPTPGGPRRKVTEVPALAVAAVAKRLGVAPATLRTWDRRYGLGPTEHAAGSHRRYTPADVGRLEVMRRLILDGVAPADAAHAALTAPTDGDRPARAPIAVPERTEAEAELASGRGGGGQVLPVSGGSSAARGLARAAMGLDAPAVTEIVTA